MADQRSIFPRRLASAQELLPEEPVWRYTDLAKYVSLLSTRSLFFARGDCLGDPHEGAMTRPDVEAFVATLKELSADERHRAVEEFQNDFKRG